MCVINVNITAGLAAVKEIFEFFAVAAAVLLKEPDKMRCYRTFAKVG